MSGIFVLMVCLIWSDTVIITPYASKVFPHWAEVVCQSATATDTISILSCVFSSAVDSDRLPKCQRGTVH